VNIEKGSSVFFERMRQMKNAGVWVLVAAAIVLAGCENKALVTCRQDNQTLQAQTNTLQQELAQANAKVQQKDAEIAKIKEENVAMQNTAMESIMSMLKKEEERSKKLQTSIAEKDTAIKGEREKVTASSLRIGELEKQVETLRALVKEQTPPPTAPAAPAQ
jgi:septal ring factor EnvC (AmiA/AmiB activator)